MPCRIIPGFGWLTLIALCFLSTAIHARQAAPTTAPAAPAFSQAELEQLLAPVALYPDSLLSQVLMASTYPLEIVEADRWAKAHPELTGDALAKELEKQSWDPSVRSLVNFPQVLATMSEKLDVTVKLGDAFIADQKAVLNAVQVLRNKAQAEGNLKTTEQQKVIVEAAPPADPTVIVQQTPAPTQIIKIEPAQPEVIYVPTYEPTVVYGAWPYPAYPPYPYYPPRPPGYWAGAAVGFGVGVACGAAWGYAWGNCNWHGGDVDIDIDRNTNINNNIDRSKFKNEMNQRNTNRQGQGGRANSFQHDPAHRKGAAYRDSQTAQKFGDRSTAQRSQARDSYRGRAEAGRQDIARGGASDYRGASDGDRTRGQSSANRAGSGSPADRPRGTDSRQNTDRAGSGRDSAAARDSGASRQRDSGANRSASPSRSGGGGFSDANRSGSSTRSASSRGSSSRSSGGFSGGGGSRGGGGRGGGRR